MGTADGRNESGLVTPDGSPWGRREFIAAMGAGVVATRMPWAPPAISQPRDTVKIEFNGAMLYTRNHTLGCVDILLPLAEGSSISDQHPDTTPAVPHFGYLAEFETSNLNPELKDSRHLLGRHVELRSSVTEEPGFRDIPEMKKITKKTTPRDYDEANERPYFSSRVRLYGGVIKPFVHGNTGEWGFSGHLNNDAPKQFKPALGILWDSGMSSVPVTATPAFNVSFTLTAAADRRFILGHLPGDPKTDWFHKIVVTKGKVDHDFKWLYKILVPNGTKYDDADPWPAKLNNRLLPAPRNVVPPMFGPRDEATVGSPNCFGGCYHC